MSRSAATTGVVVLTVAVALLLRSGERAGPDATPPPVVAPTIAATLAPTTAPPTSATTTTTTATAVPPVERVSVEVTSEVLAGPLADALPGFAGTLVATVGPWGAVDLVRWGSDGATREPLPGAFGPLAVDAGGEWMAYLADNGAGPVLRAGPLSAAPVFATAATSAAWHSSQPGRLAWLAADPEGTGATLATLDLAASGQPQPLGDLDPALLHAWDEAGFVVTDWADAGRTVELQLLTPDGSVAAAHPGVDFVDQAPGGTVLAVRHVDIRTAFLASRPNLADLSHIEWAPSNGRAEHRMAAWSPDGRHIAFLTYSAELPASWELEIWSIFGTLDHRVPLGYRAWNVAWSPDGRFVAAPGSDHRGTDVVVVYDTEAETLSAMQFDDIVQHVELLG